MASRGDGGNKKDNEEKAGVKDGEGLGLMLMGKNPASWSFLKYEIKGEKYDIYIYSYNRIHLEKVSDKSSQK